MSTEENVPLTEPDEQYKYVIHGARRSDRDNNDRSGLLFLLKIVALACVCTIFYVVTQALVTTHISASYNHPGTLPQAIVITMAIIGMLLLFVTSLVVVAFVAVFAHCLILLLQSRAISSERVRLLLKWFFGSLVLAITTTAYLALFYWL